MCRTAGSQKQGIISIPLAVPLFSCLKSSLCNCLAEHAAAEEAHGSFPTARPSHSCSSEEARVDPSADAWFL